MQPCNPRATCTSPGSIHLLPREHGSIVEMHHGDKKGACLADSGLSHEDVGYRTETDSIEIGQPISCVES